MSLTEKLAETIKPLNDLREELIVMVTVFVVLQGYIGALRHPIKDVFIHVK